MSEKNPKVLKIYNLKYPISSCSGCEPYTPYTKKACADVAHYLGLKHGGKGSFFAGDWSTKGCYAYLSGEYAGMVFYSTGGTMDEMKTSLGGTKYRPVGYDCNNLGI